MVYRHEDTVEIGYSFSNEVALGEVMATEAVSSWYLNYLNEFNVHRIQLILMHGIQLHKNYVNEYGMRKEAHFIKDFWNKNEWTDSIVYGMLPSD